MTGITMSIIFFGLLFLVAVALLCVWFGRQLLREAPINLDAKGSAGCFFMMAVLLFSATVGGIALLALSH